MPLIGLRHKTQWWEANLRVRWFWMLNTFSRLYLNSKPTSLVVKSKGSSSKGRYIYGSLVIAKTMWRLLKATPCIYSGNSAGNCEFNFSVSYVLPLIKAHSIFICTHFTWFICPLTSIGDGWKDGRLHLSPSLLKFIPPTHNVCYCLWWALITY